MVLFCFLGMLITVGFRESFAVLVTHISSNNTCEDESIFKNCTGKDLHVDWSGSTGQLMHTAFFVGQLVTSIPSGALTATFSPKRMMGITLLITSVLFLLISESRKAGIWLIFVIRALQGIVEGMAVPSMNAIISKWARKEERSRLINIAYGGVYLSPAVASFCTAATICYVSWDSIMYITGSLGVAWAIVWLLVVYPSPDQANIGEEERRLLREQLDAAKNGTGQSQSILELPWRKFFTSLPVLAVWVGSFCRNFIFAMLISEVPQYFKDSYQLSTARIGLLSAVPHVCMVVFMSFGSVLFDMLIKRRLLSVTKTRKLAQFLGYGVQGGCTLAIAFVDDYMIAFVLLCVGAAFSAFAISGFQTNPLDLAPQYAGPLTGIVRTGMLGAVVSTTLSSQLPGRYGTLKSWQEMFMIGGILHLAGVVFYLLFASGERQSWAPSPNSDPANVPREQVYDDHYTREARGGGESDPLFPGHSVGTAGGYGSNQNIPATNGDRYATINSNYSVY